MSDIFIKIKNSKSAIQLFRYGVIGLVTNSLAYLLYLIITSLGGTPKITMSIMYISVAIISFLGNRKLTFVFDGSYFGSGLRYIISHFIGYLINISILVIMVDILGYPHQFIQAAAIFAVALFLFFALKFFVFRDGSTNYS